MPPIVIKLPPSSRLSDEQFWELCGANPETNFERNPKGDLIVMSPTGGDTGNRNVEIATDFVNWNRRSNLGFVFDSNTGFKLPNGANRSPDVSWIARDRWLALTPEQRRKFPPIAPDFVLELMSPSDALEETQAKMREYMEAGVRLGWLINPDGRQVEVYQPNMTPIVLDAPPRLSDNTLLPDFILDLEFLWSDNL